MDFLFRIAILGLGYFYPAYKCFETVDLGKPKSEQLHAWCQYWIIIAIFTGFERVADTFISWLPFYGGAKLAFVVYLWHPDTKGTDYIFQTFLNPYLSKHRESVVLNLVLVRDETARVLTILCNRLMDYVQLKVSGVVHQNAVLSTNTSSQLAQDDLHFYPSILSSFCGDKMQQQPGSFPSHKPLVTQSAIWPREQCQWQQMPLSYPVQPMVDMPVNPHMQPTQRSTHHTLPSPSGPKPVNLGETAKSSMVLNSTFNEGKEEIDFEVVHSNEIPMPELSGALEMSKRHSCAQRTRSRWWLW